MAQAKLTANVAPVVTTELHHTLETHPNIQVVYFTGDGHHHFRVHQHEGSLYTRLGEFPEKIGGVYTGKTKIGVIMDPLTGKPDLRHAVTSEMSREDVLKAKPVSPLTQSLLAAPTIVAPTKEQMLEALGLTEEQLAAITANATKAKK